MVTSIMPTIRVTFSDTKETQEARFDLMRFDSDHLELTNVFTYVDWTTPGIAEMGADADGDVVCNEIGIVYFDAVDRIEVIRDGTVSVVFDKEAA